MKKNLILLAVFMMAAPFVSGQNILKNIGERARRTVEEKVGEKVENAVGNAVDKALKNKKEKGRDAQQNNPEENPIENRKAGTGKTGAQISWNNYDFVSGDEIIFEDTM